MQPPSALRRPPAAQPHVASTVQPQQPFNVQFPIVTGPRAHPEPDRPFRPRPRLHLMRFALPASQTPIQDFTTGWKEPIKLLRKDQMEEMLAADVVKRREESGDVILTEAATALTAKKMPARRRKALDTKLLAPTGRSWQRSNLFEKKTRRVFPIADLKQRRKREQRAKDALPWILEDGVAWDERVASKIEDEDIAHASTAASKDKDAPAAGERAPRAPHSGPWRSFEGHVALENEASRYAVLTISEHGREFVLQLIDRRFEFTPKPRYRPIDPEEANRLMGGVPKRGTPMHRFGGGAPPKGITTSLSERFGLSAAARGHSYGGIQSSGMRLVDRGIDDEDLFGDDDIGDQGHRRMRAERLAERKDMRGDVEDEVDFDYGAEFQDDEETGYLAGAGEDINEAALNEEEREAKKRVMNEYRMAEQDDLFGSEEDDDAQGGSKSAKGRKKGVVVNSGKDASKIAAKLKGQPKKTKNTTAKSLIIDTEDLGDESDDTDTELDPFAKKFGIGIGENELEPDLPEPEVIDTTAEPDKPQLLAAAEPPATPTRSRAGTPAPLAPLAPPSSLSRAASKRPLSPEMPTQDHVVSPTNVPAAGPMVKRQKSAMVDGDKAGGGVPLSRSNSVPASRDASARASPNLSPRPGPVSATAETTKTEVAITNEGVIEVIRANPGLPIEQLLARLKARFGPLKKRQAEVQAVVGAVSRFADKVDEATGKTIKVVVLKNKFQ